MEHAGAAGVFSAQYPVQHASPATQLWPVFLHSGRSQKQALSDGPHEISWKLGSKVKHCSPVQQLASDVHDCEIWWHAGGGTAHTPLLLQTSVGLQQGIVVEQASDVCAQVGGGPTGAVHVPLVAPGRMTHVSGVQQSPLTVQLPPSATQAGPPGVTQWFVPSQVPEQHSVPVVHDDVSGKHPPQMTPSKQNPVQQSAPVVQLAPEALQGIGGVDARHIFAGPVGRVTSVQRRPLQQPSWVPDVPVQMSPRGLQAVASPQRRTPELSGTHGTPLQH